MKPIISFGDDNYEFYAGVDDYWKITRLVMKESNDSAGIFRMVQSCKVWHFLDCEFIEHTSGSGMGLQVDRCYLILLENCNFRDNGDRNVQLYGGTLKLINCDLNGVLRMFMRLR
ncbi:hypothetical protein ES703_124885 [subsurface metagenome]